MSGWRNTFSSLAVRDFRLLWASTICVMSGFQMQMIAQGFLVYELTGSAKILALVSAGWGLPMMVLVLFGGAVADRFERKPLIQITQGAYGVISLTVAVLIATEVVTWQYLLGAAMMQGAIFSFGGPARQALVPQLVGQDRLTNAIALNSAAMSSTALVTPAIGGLLYALIGPEWVYAIMTVLGVVAVTLTSLIRPPPGQQCRSGTAMLGDIVAGLAYVKANTLVIVMLAVGLLTIMMSMPFQSLLPVFVVDVYGKESGAYGLLVSAIGLGALGGSLLVASMGRWRRGIMLISGGLASGAALIMISLVPVYWAAAGIMVVLGLGNVLPSTLSTALIMERSEDQYRGRVMSVVMMGWGMMPLGLLPLGLAMDLLGGRSTAAIMGGVMLTVTSLVLVTQKGLRDLR